MHFTLCWQPATPAPSLLRHSGLNLFLLFALADLAATFALFIPFQVEARTVVFH